MIHPDATPKPEKAILNAQRTATFWALLSMEVIIALGAIGPCCVPVHFNGLCDVVFYSLGPNHDTNHDGLVSPWEYIGKTLTIAWIAQFTCIGVPAFVSCLGLLRRRNYGLYWAWILTVILAAFCVSNLFAIFFLGGGHAMGMPILIAID